MKTISIRIDDDTRERWQKLAKAYGLNPSEHMRQAIVDRLEELEDYYVVRERISEPYEAIPSEEVWKLLGLEDDGEGDSASKDKVSSSSAQGVAAARSRGSTAHKERGVRARKAG